MSGEVALKTAETNALSNNEQSFYRGTGKSSNNKKGGFFARKKKGLTGLILTIFLLVGGGAFLGGTNSLLGPALNEVVTEVSDLQYASNTTRFGRLMTHMLDTPVDAQLKWNGSIKYRYSSMSGTFKRNLARNGIEVKGFGNKRVLVFDGQEITAQDFEAFRKSNIEFSDAYNRARRGRILGFFDNIANNIYEKLGINRNAFSKYKQTTDADADTTKFRETMTDELDGTSDNDIQNKTKYEYEYEEEYYEYDADGNPVRKTRTIHKTVDGETSTKNITGGTPTTKAQDYISSVSSKIAGASQALNWGCNIMKALNMVSIAVAANEIYQSINYFMGLAENPSKMKMGYGSESAINSFLNFMTTSSEVEVDNFQDEPTLSGSITDSGSDLAVTLQKGNGATTDGKTLTKGSPMEAQGMQKIMTGAPIDTKSTRNYSLERSISVLGGAFTTSLASYHACAIAQSAGAIASGIVTIAAAIASGGLSLIASIGWKTLAAAGIALAVSTFLQFMVPVVAKAFFTNAFESATGIPAGEFYAQGAFAANTRIARNASSQSLSDEAAIVAYNKVNQEVLALDAEIDRYNRSPFDITSRNTFLGSIAYKFGTTTSTSFIGKIKNLMRLTSSSISTITGTTLAAGENDYITTYGDCPLLEGIGAKGDIYCNPITTSDVSIINLSPEDQTYIDAINQFDNDGNSTNFDCDEEGNCTIKEKSDLANYITYCDGRDSPFGAVDANILNSASIGGAAVSILGMLPVAGDVVDLVDAAQTEANLDWATGQKCVNNPDKNPEWNTKYRYYQLYVQDQRLLSQMGAYEGSQSPVAAYIEQYDAEHPLDNSPAGYLSRIAGLDKDDAQLILDIAWYYNFLEDYDANTRIAMDGTASDLMNGEELIAKLDNDFRYYNFADNFKNDDPYAIQAIVAEHIIYADVRNRSYAV